ncbi:MAG: gliding motility lipoprotein GldD [Flavobacteriaceae bacterium]
MNNKFIIVIILGTHLFFGCKEDVLPKPKAMLRLEYPEAKFARLETDHFEFQFNQMAKVKSKTSTSVELEYPTMHGSMFINYKKVENNLEKLLSDAQKFSYEHVVKADGIEADEFINSTDKVFGMIYEVTGDAASQAQFYVTDSTQHFVTGSLYFSVKPNYDSIYPAAQYLQNDIRRIMESLRWKQ